MYGKNLQKLRELNGYSQSELASKIGVHKSTVQHWEHDRRNPSATSAYRLAHAFNIPLDYLCRRDSFTPDRLDRKYKLILSVK